jgi:hypothetical protein
MIELKTLAGLVALIFGITLFPFMRGLIRLFRVRRLRGGRNLKNYMRGGER